MMKRVEFRTTIFAGVLIVLFLSVAPLHAQVEWWDMKMIRVHDTSTGQETYGFLAGVEGEEIRRVEFVTPLSTTFVLFDTDVAMTDTAVSVETQVLEMSPSFFNTHFSDGKYKLQVTLADATTEEYDRDLTLDWPDFPSVTHPMPDATGVADAPAIHWTQTNGAFGYGVKIRATNFLHEVSRSGIAHDKTSVVFPAGTLLEGDTYQMDLIGERDWCASITRLNFEAAPAAPGPALKPRFPDNYLLGTIGEGSTASRFHAEIRPEADSHARFQITFPEAFGDFVVFESPLEANPFQVRVMYSLGASGIPAGTYTITLENDAGPPSLIQITPPSQHPAIPAILAPSPGQSVQPGYLTEWNIGSGNAPDALIWEVNLDDWDVNSFLEPAITQAAIPAFSPARAQAEDAELTVIGLTYSSSGNSTGFAASGTGLEFEIHYPARAAKEAWPSYR